MNAKGRIGILTGGGDVPGLNSVIKSVVYRATEVNRGVIGLRKGWEALTHMDPDLEMDPSYVLALNRENTRTIDRSGGTWLHTSRTNPLKVKAGKTPRWMKPADLEKLKRENGFYDFANPALKNLERLGISTLIAIGGDDTLSFAAWLDKQGYPVIGIPKTMDNDVQGTEYCIGFSTAITRAKELITRQRTTLGSHERVGIFRIFGRDAGFTALYTAYVASIRCVIPEYPFDLQHLIDLLLEDKRVNPSRYSLVVASEGAVWKGEQVAEYGEMDAYGHKKKVDIGHALAQEIKRITGEDTMSSDLTYDLRSGEPDMFDQMVATTFANVAMDLIRDGVSGRLVGIQGGRYAHAPLPDPKLGPRTVDVASLYNADRYRPNYSAKLGQPLLLSAVAG